tara:strand:- start:8054 stop:8542 length:489 start_codon:yes stop_codon:yes gene_type:complete
MKKLRTYLIVLLLTTSCAFGQQIYNNDTLVNVKLSDIEKSYLQSINKSEQIDNLEHELLILKEELSIINKIYAKQVLRDSAQVKLSNILQTKLDKANKTTLFKGVLGAGITFSHSIVSNSLDNATLSLNIGLVLKEKYIPSFDFGLDLNKNLVFGFKLQTIF